MAHHPIAAITGLGFSDLSRKPGPSARQLACDAIRSAASDADLPLSRLDGLLLNRSPLEPSDVLPLSIQRDLGMRNLRLLTSIEGEGGSAIQMVQYAALAVQAGLATHVVCVFADAPIAPTVSAGQAFAVSVPITGIAGWENEIGLHGAAAAFALKTTRYAKLYGAKSEDFGAWALSERKWAAGNPRAFLRTPLTMDDYLASRWIAKPMRLLDCAYPINGAIAVIVASVSEAAHSGPAVYIQGIGQGHGTAAHFGSNEPELWTGGEIAVQGAYRMARVGPSDISIAELYAPFTCTGLISLEESGFCKRGEGAAFVAQGSTAPGGKLPVNTGGGHLSSFYLQGMTPLSEAIIQARGDGGERQVGRRDVILATGFGGYQEFHGALIISPHARLS
jgi:acetyl-CoA acetyltransferase